MAIARAVAGGRSLLLADEPTGLRALILHNVDLSLPDEFGPVIPLATLVGVLVLTLIVIRGPLRRATRIQPGTALRYQ